MFLNRAQLAWQVPLLHANNNSGEKTYNYQGFFGAQVLLLLILSKEHDTQCTWSVGLIHIQLVEMRASRGIWRVDLNFVKNIGNKINPLMK